ncbi:MAG TPA: tetratricopeptide repeat protein, partial [candidate division Zixibacteria bacterium]|nr:tetratricopeptide repeat protein [candidate division Zixibacteria bacterium]
MLTVTISSGTLRRLGGAALALALCVSAPVPAVAQGAAHQNFIQAEPDTLLDRDRYSVAQQKRMLPPDQVVRLQTARGQMKSGDYAGAADLLELVYRDYPQDPRVIALLKQCYIELKRYHSAIDLLTAQTRLEHGEMQPLLDLAEVYFEAEKPDSAVRQIDFALAQPRDTAAILDARPYIRRALTLLIDNWQDSLALDYAYWLRGETGDQLLFGDLVADALERRRDFAGAMRELFAILRIDTLDVNRRAGASAADRKLAQLFEYPDAQSVVQTELERLTRESPADTLALRYLGELYMRTEQFDPAFSLYVRYDSLSERGDQYLLRYLRECYDRKLYEQALRMGEYILATDTAGVAAGATRFYQAGALNALGRSREAITAYQRIIDSDRSRSGKAEAAYQIGEIYLERLGQPDSALLQFQRSLRETPHGPISWKNNFGLLKLELIDGDTDAARRRLQALLEAPLDDETAEQALYRSARLDLITADIDSASAGFMRVIERYPRGFFVNDALSVLMVLQQGAEASPELLELYCASELYRERRMNDSLLQTLERLASHEDTSLADVALLDLGRSALATADTTRALEYIGGLAGRFPDSYFAPHAEKLKADIYFARTEKRQQALAIYRALLRDYGSYPFAAQVREILKANGEDTGQPD